MTNELKTLLFVALGEVSICWSETPKGVFDSNLATEIGNKLVDAIEAQEKKERENSYSDGWNDGWNDCEKSFKE